MNGQLERLPSELAKRITQTIKNTKRRRAKTIIHRSFHAVKNGRNCTALEPLLFLKRVVRSGHGAVVERGNLNGV
jgi:hypothetical protein